MTVNIERISFTVDKYEKMIETGILGKDDRVELIRGEIVKKELISLRHAACVARLMALFTTRFGSSAIVWPQNPIRIGGHSMPEPDVALLKPSTDFYSEARPTPQDVLLLVEVADSSVARDKSAKVPLYAEANVPELWIVDLIENVIEVYADPAGGAYRKVSGSKSGDTLSVPIALDTVVSVDVGLGHYFLTRR